MARSFFSELAANVYVGVDNRVPESSFQALHSGRFAPQLNLELPQSPECLLAHLCDFRSRQLARNQRRGAGPKRRFDRSKIPGTHRLQQYARCF